MQDEVSPLAGGPNASEMETGPLVQLRITLGRRVWRVGPAWAVLAGALAAGAPLTTSEGWLRLAAAVVLADLVWGVLRKFSQFPPSRAVPPHSVLPALPYLQPTAPLMRLVQALVAGRGETQPGVHAVWQELLIGLALATALSLLLGSSMLLLSALVAVTVLLAGALARRGNHPALCLALLDVAWPWSAGALLAWRGFATMSLAAAGPVVLLAAAFTVLQWGVQRARLAQTSAGTGLWLGLVAVLAVLAGLQQPGALALSAVLFAPPAWWLAGRAEAALTRSLPWWWAAMLLAAGAVR